MMRNSFEYELEDLFSTEEKTISGDSGYDFSEPEKEVRFSTENELDLKFGKTIYLPIQLSKALLPKVGVFIPKGFRPAAAIKNSRRFSAIDAVVFLHGHIYPCDNKGVSKFDKGGIEYYWNTPAFSFLREEFALSGRNALLIAPTFTNKLNRGSNTFGNLDANKKFDFLLGECLKNLKNTGDIPPDSEIRNVILAGHSAGGLPMQSILWAINSTGQNIVECWGFECLYFGTDIYWAWLNFSPGKNFIHYRQKKAFAGQTARLLKHANFKDVNDGKGHCSLVQEKWRTSLENCRWLQTLNSSSAKSGAGAISRETSDFGYESDFESEFKLEKGNLYTGKIVVAGVPNGKNQRAALKKKGGAYVEITESPSVFLREIIRSAKAKALKAGKKDIAEKLNSEGWFGQFTRDFSFLGRKLKKGQFVHLELAKLLKDIEANFLTGLAMSDAKKAGDILLKNSPEGLSGSRLTSSTATFSMHMFGLAVDVNYLGNPYIEESDIKAVNNVLQNAASLTNTKPLTYRKHEKDRFADRFDFIQALDGVIENYFKLLDDPPALESCLQSSQSPDWHGLSVKDAMQRIQKNLDNLAGFLARKSYKDYFKKHAILDFDKRFVTGMERMGLHWGGDYGDMMHFDLRKTGVGFYIEQARNEYAGKVQRQAARLYKEKKYGEYSPV
jgi:hypothetical protein